MGKFYCELNDKCIDEEWVCDGFQDCTDDLDASEDERNCG